MTIQEEYWHKRWQNFIHDVKTDDDYFFSMTDILFLSQMLSKKVLFIMIGASGSGKTTLSTQLETTYGCNVYEQDVMLLEGKTYYEQMRIYNHMLDSSNFVCVDSTNITKDMRERFVLPARRKGFVVVAIIMDEDKQVIMERNEKRKIMDLEKISTDIEKIEIPLVFSETHFTITHHEFKNIFAPLFLSEMPNILDFRKGWIID